MTETKIKLIKIQNQLVTLINLKNAEQNEKKEVEISITDDDDIINIGDDWKYNQVINNEAIYVSYRKKGEELFTHENVLWGSMMVRGWFWNYLVLEENENDWIVASPKPTIGYSGISRCGYLIISVFVLLILGSWRIWKNRKKTSKQ